MRLKAYVPFLLIALIASLTTLARAQDQSGEEDVRGVFLTSRPASSSGHSSSANPRPHPKRRPPQSSNRPTTLTDGRHDAGPGGNISKSLTPSDSGTGVGKQPAKSPLSTRPAAPLGLGYTLYMRDAQGDAVRVDPAHEFHNGDRVRISLEPNTDSYLYVFHTENGGEPEMIYPDARLDGGDNFIEAHVPTEIPSSQAQDERLRWFAFYGQPATERLYVVITREPLPLVPVGDDLVNYCQANRDRCPWHPSVDIWAKVDQQMKARVLVNKEKSYGQAQTAGEREATTRGFGLDQSAPAPSVIRMNATSNSPVLVTALDLVHK
jgi:hypothetical protein